MSLAQVDYVVEPVYITFFADKIEVLTDKNQICPALYSFQLLKFIRNP